MTTTLIIALAAALVVLVLGAPGEETRVRRGRHRTRRLRPAAVRMHLADGAVDDAPLENDSRWILVRDGHRARTVPT